MRQIHSVKSFYTMQPHLVLTLMPTGPLVEQVIASTMGLKGLTCVCLASPSLGYQLCCDTNPHSTAGTFVILWKKGWSWFWCLWGKKSSFQIWFPRCELWEKAVVFLHARTGCPTLRAGRKGFFTSGLSSNLPVSGDPVFNHTSLMVPAYGKRALYILRAEYFSS